MAESDDEFNRIVEGLDLELPFPAEAETEAEEPSQRHPSDPRFQPEAKRRAPTEHDGDAAYRTPPPRPRRALGRARALAWIAVLGGPSLLVVATIAGILLPRAVVFSAALIFVAAVIYLISQLPERGPSHPDWPDDGAVL